MICSQVIHTHYLSEHSLDGQGVRAVPALECPIDPELDVRHNLQHLLAVVFVQQLGTRHSKQNVHVHCTPSLLRAEREAVVQLQSFSSLLLICQ